MKADCGIRMPFNVHFRIVSFIVKRRFPFLHQEKDLTNKFHVSFHPISSQNSFLKRGTFNLFVRNLISLGLIPQVVLLSQPEHNF